MTKRKITAKEIFSIPNLMGYFRILLIPVFTWIYVQADSVSDYYTAAVLVGISGLTDMFDGKVARKFNMITELGKFIDPLADKLTQGALVICFAIRYPLMRAVLVLFIVKEGFMGIMGLLLLPRGKKLDGAKWFGKVSTFVFYTVMFIIIVFPSLDIGVRDILILVSGIFLLLAFLLYAQVFLRMYQETQRKK